MDVVGIPCLFLGLCQGSMETADVNSHSGHKSDPSVAVLPPAAKGLTPVVTVLTPPLVQFDPSEHYRRSGSAMLEKKQMF